MGIGTERIMVVDDEAGMCRLLQAVLGDAGYQVAAFQDPLEAVKVLDRERFDLVISDVRMPNLSGVDMLKAVKSRSPSTAVILVTAFGTTKAAVEALRLGTSDYITKPFRNEEIHFVVEGVLARRRLACENARLRQELAAVDGFGAMAGVSPAIRRAFRELAEAAESEEALLIQGERGTGRETAARAVHLGGRRASQPFVLVDGAVLASEQAEERLFGRPAGVFADAFTGQAGLLAMAEGGSLLLKDMELLSEPVRTRLLRFLQDRKVRRPGSIESSKLDVRVIFAVGPAPENLFQKFAGARVDLPSLRERLEDVAPLAAHFLGRASRRYARGARAFTSEAVEALRAYHWPGNVGELEDAVERSAATTLQGPLDVRSLPPAIAERIVLSGQAQTVCFRDAKQSVVDAFERAYLLRLIKNFEGNMTRAALAAEMDRKNLYELFKKHGLDPRRAAEPDAKDTVVF